MKILLAQFYTQPNPVYIKVAEELRRAGHPTLVGALNGQGELEWHEGETLVSKQTLATLPKGGRSWLRPLRNRYARWQQLRAIRDFIRQYNPDIVQLNASNFYRLLPLGMPRRTHYVLDMRQINEAYGATALGRLRAWLFNRSREVFSRRVYDHTTFLHAAGAEKVLGPDWTRWASVVPMGVDEQFLTATRPQPAGELAAVPDAESVAGPVYPAGGERPDGPVTFIYIGRLTPRRMLERLIEAAAIVKQRTRDFRFVFMGMDAADGAYQRMIHDLALDDVMDIMPPVAYETVPHEVLKYDVAVAYVPELPVDWMYQPTLKVLEYSALGMPILATDFKPNRDFVTPGVNGLLVDNDPAHIAEAMRRFIEDPDFLNDCRRAAATRRAIDTWDDVAHLYLENVYRPLVNGTKAAVR